MPRPEVIVDPEGLESARARTLREPEQVARRDVHPERLVDREVDAERSLIAHRWFRTALALTGARYVLGAGHRIAAPPRPVKAGRLVRDVAGRGNLARSVQLPELRRPPGSRTRIGDALPALVREENDGTALST